MKRILTIGFTQKSARDFFEALKDGHVGLLLDIRLHNSSQLAGFAKGSDLPYFLEQICRVPYRYEPLFAPSPELLDGYRHKQFGWTEFEARYRSLMVERQAVERFLSGFGDLESVCLLCSEADPAHCHRRFLAEMVQAACPQIEIIHL